MLQEGGFRAFIPAPLPPVPPIAYDDDMRMLVSDADRALARLDGITCVLPNPDLLVEMYLTREALLSSQIMTIGLTQQRSGSNPARSP